MDAKAIDLNALVERVARGTSTSRDADLLRDIFTLKAQMHVCAEALTVILMHGPFIRKHFAVDLRAEVTEALMEDVIEAEQEEVDETAAAILDQLDQAHSDDEESAPCG